jgi:serine beta-lactamase-like protein LACTB, mitochondrial
MNSGWGLTTRWIRFVHLLALCLTTLIVTPQASAAELAPEVSKSIDEAVTKFMEKQHVPGMSVAIVSQGDVALERGYGLADIENDVPATAETVYRLASISKMLTGVAVMQLVEQSKIDLAAPIQKYVPNFPEKQAPITCELLLKHQSGIRHYKGDEVRSAVAYRRIGDALKVFQDEPLLFSPGTKMSYTTYGFNLLGTAIEGASGTDYVSYVQEHVCKPAGMTSIQPDRQEKIIPHRAAGYRRMGTAAVSVLVNDFAVDVSNKIPGGGWCSTAGDLARFAIALADARLVSRETLEKMWTRQSTSDGKQTESGLGCFVSDYKGQRRISHSGGQPKVSTFLILAPDQKMAVALMCNLRDTGLQPLAGELLGLLNP